MLIIAFEKKTNESLTISFVSVARRLSLSNTKKGIAPCEFNKQYITTHNCLVAIAFLNEAVRNFLISYFLVSPSRSNTNHTNKITPYTKGSKRRCCSVFVL